MLSIEGYTTVKKTLLDVKTFNKDSRLFPGKVHKEKKKEEENNSNSKIKKDAYEEDERNESDSSCKINNQIAVVKNYNEEQNTPSSSFENAENDQENNFLF